MPFIQTTKFDKRKPFLLVSQTESDWSSLLWTLHVAITS